MPTSARQPDLLVDTSVAVALVVADHEQHEAVLTALNGRRLGLAGHAAFETFSVLTRLPPPHRRPASVVAKLLSANFPATRFLSADGAAALLARLRDGEIAGGAIYDALVGAAAREHALVLATSDRRAIDTYRALDVQVEILSPVSRG
jgi:predicted nucleic acid-binding protein